MVPQDWRLGVDLYYHSALDRPQGVSLRHTVNVAVGAEVYATETMPIAFGFFTDLHPEAELVDFGSRQMDYYGLTFAMSFLSPYDVVGSEKTDRITFSTTIGAHYAFGIGKVAGLFVDWSAPAAKPYPAVFTTERTITGHDVHLFLASTLRY